MTRVYTEVLVGSDGSPTARRAVTTATTLAAALDVPLTVATAWRPEASDAQPPTDDTPPSPDDTRPAEATWAAETVAEAAATAREAGVDDVRRETPEGGPADALLRLSDGRAGALVVVGSRGLDQRRERWVGNVPHQLTHHCRRDLLLIRPGPAMRDAWAAVAIATDGSPTAALAVEHGIALCRALAVTPTLVTVASEEEAGQRTLDAVAEADDDVPRRVIVGRDVRHLLVDAAGDHDLLVLGNKGMSGPSRLLGSIANHITHEVPTDLLLVNTTR